MLELRDIRKSYEGQPLLAGLSFRVQAGETVCLLGPSGSGKSTLLEIIAGLQAPDGGGVFWDGDDITSWPAHRRDFGLVFQDYALFPHMDVAANAAFGLRMRRWAPELARQRVVEVLQLVGLEGFERRAVGELSGGEQQRVALARALAPRPRLLMFDEPLAALDRGLREELQTELRRILRSSGLPAIYVTHDQEEAFVMGERVLILHAGTIISEGKPAEVTRRPRHAWVARFLGLGTVVSGIVAGSDGQRLLVNTPVGSVRVGETATVAIGDRASVLIRPEHVEISAASSDHSLRVTDVVFQRDRYRVTLENGLYLYAQSPPRPGDSVTVAIGEAELLDGK